MCSITLGIVRSLPSVLDGDLLDNKHNIYKAQQPKLGGDPLHNMNQKYIQDPTNQEDNTYKDTTTHPWEETSLMHMYKHLSTTMDNRQEAYQLLMNEIQNICVQIQSQQQ